MQVPASYKQQTPVDSQKMLASKLIRSFLGKGLLLTCGAVALVPECVPAQEHINVRPTASVAWDQLVQLEAARTASSVKTPMLSPYLSGPIELTVHSSDEKRSSSDTPLGFHSGNPIPALFQGPSFSSPAQGFEAVADNDMVIPPNANGAVGPAHVVTMLNAGVRIQAKTGAVTSTMSLASFWAPLHGVPFDPRLQYDALSERWIAACDANPWSDSSKVFLAISSTSDPMGTWNFYSFNADPGDTLWADYTCLGFNSKWIAITSNMFRLGSYPAFRGPAMWVIDKSSALAGGELTVTLFPPKFDLAGAVTSSTLQPCVTFGLEPKLYIVDRAPLSSGDRRTLRLSEISGSGSAPVWSVSTGSTVISGSGLFTVTNNFDLVQVKASQKGTDAGIETADPRIVNAVFRNGKIWCTHSGGLPVGHVDRTAAFWYQLDPVAMEATGDPIVQSGVLDGGVGVHHYYPSITANATGDACVAFTRSDTARFAEAVYAGRLGTDPPNIMRQITVLKAGLDHYRKTFGTSRVRWGDYSTTLVDPSDDHTFWTIQEYAASSTGPDPNDDQWGTWWSKVVPETPVSKVEVNTSAASDRFLLAQNYPNPFNPTTIIQFAVSKSGPATMKVYNILGQEVATLFDANAEAGRIYTAHFDGVTLPSGIYWYSLSSAGRVGTKRMLLLK
jgi:hypothetical protein